MKKLKEWEPWGGWVGLFGLCGYNHRCAERVTEKLSFGGDGHVLQRAERERALCGNNLEILRGDKIVLEPSYCAGKREIQGSKILLSKNARRIPAFSSCSSTRGRICE